MTIAELTAGLSSFDRFVGLNGDLKNAHYMRGMFAGDEMESVTIAVNNVWGGRGKDGASVQSYEKIGYHAGSTDFIRGVLAAGCPVRVFRAGGDGISIFELEG
jgi:hypothetical protein